MQGTPTDVAASSDGLGALVLQQSFHFVGQVCVCVCVCVCVVFHILHVHTVIQCCSVCVCVCACVCVVEYTYMCNSFVNICMHVLMMDETIKLFFSSHINSYVYTLANTHIYGFRKHVCLSLHI